MTHAQAIAERAVAAVGSGYDLTSDLWLPRVKPGRIVDFGCDPASLSDLFLPAGVVVKQVPDVIKSDKGERMRFSSDVLSFHQMAEQLNQSFSLSGKIPSGLFNSMFDLKGCWQKDTASTKSLCFDGWFIELYSVEITRSRLVLQDQIKRDVPSTWDPLALANFIEKYGTHIIVGVKIGGKDVVYLKQLQNSSLSPSEMQNLLKKLADEKFSEYSGGNFTARSSELPRKYNDYRSIVLPAHNLGRSVAHLKKEDIVSIHVRRGGVNTAQSHSAWLSTLHESPDVISMSFVPIISLLNGVMGSGFISHAINLYLRYKPPIEELHQFLEFQLPRVWAPSYGDLPLGPQRKKGSLPSLQFSLMGPKLHVNTTQADSQNRPVTGIRLYLEGDRNDRLAVHLHHLASLPCSFQISDEPASSDDVTLDERAYYEPIKWALLSHVCTAPVQYNGPGIDECAAIVTKAWLEVKDIGLRKVLFLRLGFSSVASMRIRRSEWDGHSSISRKSGSFSGLISSRFSGSQEPVQPTKQKIEVNSAVFPKGPPVPLRVQKLSKFVDTSEITRGPDDLPGYWVVTGAKLCAEGGKISLKVKYSLLIEMIDDDEI
ncbi:MACPF domain-containing protein NSL1 [Rhynchospora pubera]|uniref:MACPF domain-containing protein NSL1 n=1 Tax=Rhynchospora pubera TaxID=906938 RepID=A0AAV8DP73_9POAL|nr:MACPF domain-containing protein NSL1 [Rhynchospora pubera]